MGSSSELLKGSGGKGFFSENDPPGTSTGWVQVVEEGTAQQTDLKDGSPVFWDAPHNTKPKYMIVATVQTDRKEDSDDDGRRVIFFSGHKFTALREATEYCGYSFDKGDWINVTKIGESDREPQKRGFNKAILWDVKHRRGSGVVLDGGTPTDQTPAQTVPMNSGAVKPADFPQAAWDVMPEDARAALVASRAPAGPQRPDSIPQVAWDAMSEEARKAVVASLGGTPV